MHTDSMSVRKLIIPIKLKTALSMIVEYQRYLKRDFHRRSVSYLSRVGTFHMAPNLYNLAKKLS